MSSEQGAGYSFEFKNQVLDDYYCKKCNLVARKLCVTSCCGEHYCKSCISADINQQRCPECGNGSFSIMELVKLQRRITSLLVYCTMKERGCKWSGKLEELDTHINPDLENCQYIDTTCPLDCHQPVPRNKLSDHLSEECMKRSYVCQFCSFNATYEEIVNVHLPKCLYVPLQCPNLCGVSCEREMMEDHIKTCRLQRVVCQFNAVGCPEEFKREEQEAHTKEYIQNHLFMTATMLSQLKVQECSVWHKMEELQSDTKSEVEKLHQVVDKLGSQLQSYKTKLDEENTRHKQQLDSYKRKLENQEYKLKELEIKFDHQSIKLKELETFKQSMTSMSESHPTGIMVSGGGSCQPLRPASSQPPFVSRSRLPTSFQSLFVPRSQLPTSSQPLRVAEPMEKLCRYPGCSYYAYEDLNRYCPDCYEDLFSKQVDRDMYPLV